MPGFDGTGPRGMGPMTGRGEGYCACTLPSSGTGKPVYGYVGLAGMPQVIGDYRRIPLAKNSADSVGGMSVPFARSPRLGLRRGFGRGMGRRRGRDRWF